MLKMKLNATGIIVMPVAFFILKTAKYTRDEHANEYKFMRPYKVPVEQIIETFKSKMQSDLEKADDGIYTWIIKDDNVMYFSKTLGNQEIGSLHVNLDMYSGEANIVAAGELKKEGPTVTYNLRSGTYMDKVIKTRAIRNEKIKVVSDFISTKGLTPKFLKCKGDENGNGTEECTEEYETLAGMNIIDKQSSILTPMAEIELYKSMFTVEEDSDEEQSGGYTSRQRSRSRSKSKSRRGKTRKSRLT